FTAVLRQLSLPAACLIELDKTDALPETHPAYGKKTAAETAAWICSGQRCLPSVTNPADFREMLRMERSATQRPPANDG
ncbi:MAG: hypothetical protein RBS08_02435, partial [Bdellovibrionales bacterium]|nr:hypothetical protein [Bdellovibrionales bacterium]